jgi:hypothetical protein
VQVAVCQVILGPALIIQADCEPKRARGGRQFPSAGSDQPIPTRCMAMHALSVVRRTPCLKRSRGWIVWSNSDSRVRSDCEIPFDRLPWSIRAATLYSGSRLPQPSISNTLRGLSILRSSNCRSPRMGFVSNLKCWR